MATWIAHLRIADKILGEFSGLNRDAFVAGNIAPDSGVPNEDWSEFTPPPSITHWKNDFIDAEAFFRKYIVNSILDKDPEYFSFVVGYYVHLLSDIEWGKMCDAKADNENIKAILKSNPEFIWKIKEDWYGHDFIYLKEYPESLFFTCFQHLGEVRDYLDYFPKGAFTNRFKYIKDYYLENYESEKKEFVYLSKNEMDSFIVDAGRKIAATLRDKALLR